MINANMRLYDYYTYGALDAYGQPQLSAEAQGKVKIAISILSQTIQDNIKYQGATYIGLTHAALDSSFVLQYDNNTRLKVLYVNPQGTYKQVFLAEI